MSRIEAIYRGLAEFADATDRASPLVFVGRERERTRLEKTLDEVRRGDTQGQTLIIQGVPGAGKTALLNELRRRYGRDAESNVVVAEARASWLDAAPLDFVTNLSSRVPSRTAAVEQRIGLKLAAKDTLAVGRTIPRGTALSLTRGKRLRDRLNASLDLNETSSLDECLDAYATWIWQEGVTVAVAVDEAQTLERSKRVRRIVSELHLGSRAPVVLLAFGLQNTSGRLRELGLSRPSRRRVVRIGLLSPGQGREAIDKTLDALGLSAGESAWNDHLDEQGVSREAWTDWRSQTVERLAEASNDFPQHVNSALAGLCQALAEQGRERFAPTPELAADALRHALDCRREYYEGRLFGSDPAARAVYGRVARDMRNDDTLSCAALRLRRALDKIARKGTTGSDLLDGALARVVFEMEGNYVRYPIPSMRDHLADDYRGLVERDPDAADLAAKAWGQR